jgi:hypothetical protein
MPTKMTLGFVRNALPFVAGAALALGGCAGAVDEAAGNGGDTKPIGFHRVAQAGEPHAAAQQLENERPIAEEEAAKMLERSRQPSDLIIIHFFQPDLTVVEDDRDQLLWDPGIGWYWGSARGFTIKNIGTLDESTFHVAVLQGADSYGFDVGGLKAGASQYFQITKPSYLGPACGTNAVILVNPFNAAPESNYSNNSTTVAGLCLL